MPLRRDDPTGAGIMMLPWQPERRMPLTALSGAGHRGRLEDESPGALSWGTSKCPATEYPEAAFATRSPAAASDSESPSSE
jgi:hypothetical protein